MILRRFGVIGCVLALLAAGGCSMRHPACVSETELASAQVDSLSLDEYLSLPEAARLRRSERAEELLAPIDVIRAQQASIDRLFSAPFMYYPYQAFRSMPALGDVLAHLDAALDLDPARADLWLLRGRLLDLAGDRRRARASLAAAWLAVDQAPTRQDDVARLRRDIAVSAAWIERDAGWWDAGLAWLDRPGVRWSQDSEAQLLRGLLLAGRGELEEAMRLSFGLPPVMIPVIDQLGVNGRLGRSRRPNDMLKRWLQAEVWMRRGRRDLAWSVLGEVPYWRRMVTLPHRLYQDLGLYAELSDRVEEANLFYALAYVRREYRSTIRPVPLSCEPVLAGLPRRDINFYQLESGAFHGGSLLAYAMASSVRAMTASDPDRAERSYLLAIDALDECLRRGIGHHLALAMRGQLRFSRGHYVLAEMDLAAARTVFARRGEQEPWTSFLLGLIALGRDRPAEARTLLEESLAADPDRARAWDALGVAAVHLDDRTGAAEAFERAIAADPGLASAHFNRGLLRAQEGDLDGGLRDFGEAARLDPDNMQMARVIQLASLARREGRPFMLGRHENSGWEPAGMDVAAHEGGAFAPTSLAGDPAWRSRIAGILADLLDEAGRQARAEGLDATELARLAEDYRRDPSPEHRKVLAHAFLWLDLHAEARALLAPAWGRDLDQDEVVLLLWLDQRAGEESRLQALARELGGDLALEVDTFGFGAVVMQLMGLDRDPRSGLQTTFQRYDAEHNRGAAPTGVKWILGRARAWRARFDARATGIGNPPTDPRGEGAYLVPSSADGGNTQPQVRALTAGKR